MRKLFQLLAVIGPGIITANMNNDAGAIATYSVAGAHTGYRLLWVLVPITVALVMVQEMSARMGIVSGKGLADLIREKYGLRITFYTMIFLIIADLGNTMAEFAGVASAAAIFGVPKIVSVPLAAALIWLVVTKGNYKAVERVFIAGCSVFLSYIASVLLIGPEWELIGKSLVSPDFSAISAGDLPIIVGLLGTSITPWMQFYIQSSVVEKGVSIKHLWHNKADIITGCLLMFLVALSIIICCAATIGLAGIPIRDAADAAAALAPLAGPHSSIIFGIGLLNASIFAGALLPLATSYYVCEGMGWESGIDKSFKEAPKFFSIFTSLLLISVALVLLPNMNLLRIMLWSQILNGIFIPLILLFIINLCNDPEVVGARTNAPLYNAINYLIVFVMFATNALMLTLEFP